MVKCSDCGFTLFRSPERQEQEAFFSRCEACDQLIDNWKNRGIIDTSAPETIPKRQTKRWNGLPIEIKTPVEAVGFMQPITSSFPWGEWDGEASACSQDNLPEHPAKIAIGVDTTSVEANLTGKASHVGGVENGTCHAGGPEGDGATGTEFGTSAST